MIKVKLIDLLKATNTLNKIKTTELNGLLAFKFGKAIQEITSELELYYTSRQNIFNKYCEKDQNGNIKIINDIVQLLPEYIQIGNQELKQLNNLEVELNIPTLEEKDLENFKLTPQEIIDIIWWIK